MDVDTVCARDGLAEDEVNGILRLVRNGSQTRSSRQQRTKRSPRLSGRLLIKIAMPARRHAAACSATEFNRQSKELQDELDRVINETLNKYLNQ
ncbi:hypothetical protein LZ023_36095 (plasmid) [Pseudomonas silvicola]|nr:hypothetical protein LZ023_36095 [Pseudomonas silvicola]